MIYDARKMLPAEAADIYVRLFDGTLLSGVVACDTDEGWVERVPLRETLGGDTHPIPAGPVLREYISYEVVRGSTRETLHTVRGAE